MENELSKKEFLSNLYALRAGLSVISQINDEIENRANVVESKDWYIEESTGIWGFFFPTNIDKSKKLKEFETITKLYNYNYNYYNDISGEADQEKRNEYFSKINMIQRMIFCDWLNTNEAEEYFISKKDGAINKCNQCQKKLEQMKNDAEDYENKIQFSLEQKKKYNMLAVLTIPTIIGAIVFISKAKKSSSSIYLYSKKLADSKSPRRLVEIDLYNQRQEVKKYETNIQSMKEMRKLIQSYNEKTDTIMQNSIAIYDALQKSFNKLLDERDWQYLDLIIYYFETGRADNKKEALQLLEREIQTQRIVESVEEAKQCICSTIRMAASQISSQLRTISSKLSQIASYQQTQIAQNAELISQTRLQNALIEKSNVTSEQLMKNVKYIKEYGVRIKK